MLFYWQVIDPDTEQDNCPCYLYSASVYFFCWIWYSCKYLSKTVWLLVL